MMTNIMIYYGKQFIVNCTAHGEKKLKISHEWSMFYYLLIEKHINPM